MVKIIDTPTTITEFVYQAVTIKYENTCCRRPRKFDKACKKGLESEGFAVDYVTDGETASTRIEMCKKEYDIIILDLMLPKKDGIQVCKEVRAKKIATPILMLTAKDSAEDIIAGLNAGADDYLIKPFSFEILLARIRALLRRPELLLPTKLQIQHITLDPASKKVFKKK